MSGLSIGARLDVGPRPGKHFAQTSFIIFSHSTEQGGGATECGEPVKEVHVRLPPSTEARLHNINQVVLAENQQIVKLK